MQSLGIKSAIRGAVVFSAGVSTLALAAAAWAEDPAGQAADTTVTSTTDPTDQAKEIVVTGYAASLQRAIDNKRLLDVISDGISAEDIGKYPEQNIAESLQRVTGVQITRSLGDGQFLSVRGLDPKFTDTLYNGRQLPSASGTRAFDYQVVTANFASQVDIYKSPTADLIESGLAATVNMQSLRPLTIGKQRISMIAEGTYDEQSRGRIRPHISALYTNTWLDGRLGWSVSFDVNQRNLNDQQFVTDGVLPDGTYAGPGTQYRVFGIHQNDLVGTDKRLSGTSTLQFKPTDNLELRFDTLISRFEQKYNYFQGNNWYAGAGALGASPTDSETVDADGVERAWSGTNVFSWTQANRFDFLQNMFSNAFGGTLKLGEWKIDAEASYGKATERTTQTYISWATSPPGASLSYDTTVDPGGPINFGFYNGFDPTDKSHYYFFGVQGNYKQPVTDKIWNGKIDISRKLDLGLIKGVKFGANFEDRTLASTPNAMPASAAGFPSDMSQYLTVYHNPTYFDSYNGPAQFPRSFLTVDLNKFFADFPLSSIVGNNKPVQVLSTTTIVEEKSAAGYARVDLATDDERLKGNFGVRYVYTQEASSGYVPTPDALLVYGYFGANTLGYTAAAIQAQKHSYRNLLPSANLSYLLSNDLIVRLAAARVMQRPDMNLLAAASSPNASAGPPPAGSTVPWIGTLALGNPSLKPYLANQFDISLEWYFGKRSLLAADFFYKDVKNLVLTNYFHQSATVTLGSGLPGSGTTLPIDFTVSQPQNAESTTVKGVEVGYQQPFDFLPGIFRWFGVQANMTHIWSKSVVLNQGQAALPLTGISKNTYNLGGYFDNGRFALHAGYNYRSSWVADPISYFGDGAFVKGYGQLDVSASFQINKTFSVSASAVNLTQTPFREVDKYGITRVYDLSGRRYYVGLRASF
jgi:iron complex outermembrane receptor protein